jgi:NagD protein
MIKVVLFDLDGTVYLGGKLIKGADALFRKLQKQGVPFAFMTNNSSIGPADYLEKLKSLNLPATKDNILTSCEAAKLMLDDLKLGPKIYVLGTKKFAEYLASVGFENTENNPSAVLVGFDKELTFEKLTAATRFVHKGVPLVASHPDLECPSPDGPLSDAGMILAAIKSSTGVSPKAIAGKPNRWIVKLAREKFGVKNDEIAIVGDRMSTDMRMAHKFGMKGVLVLSGVTKRADLKKFNFAPDVIVDSVADFKDDKVFSKLLK